MELLVALLLLSLVFLLLSSGVQFGTRAWNVGQEEPSSTSDVATVQHLLRRVLSEARPVMVESTPSERRHVFFDGTQNSVRLIAPIPEHLGIGGFYEVALYLAEGDGSGKRLEMSWHLSRGAGTPSETQIQERRVVLLDRIANIQFAYFGSLRPQDRPSWTDNWQDREWLPNLIRIELTFDDGQRIWPDLTVATHVQSLSLIIDPESF